MQRLQSLMEGNCQEIGRQGSQLMESDHRGRRLTNPHEQSQRYNTKKKYSEQNVLSTDRESSVRSIECTYREQNDECHLDDELYELDLSVIEEQMSVGSSSIPLQEKYRHLLLDYLGANFTIEQRKIIQVQIKVDQLLDYLRQHRNRQKGSLFSEVKKILQKNYEITFELEHLKQILFINPNFYIWSQKKDQKGRLDILIALPEDAELEERKVEFRKQIFEYLTKNDGFSNQKKLSIPCINFPFTLKQQHQKRQQSLLIISNTSNFWSNRLSSTSKINPFDALKPGNARNFQQMLMQRIKQNQQRIKAQKQKQKIIKFGGKQLLAVFDQLPKIYKKRQKSSMFKSSIIQDLDRSLNIKEEVLCKILEVLISKHGNFFRIIDHKNGQIVQIQRKLYNQIRILIQRQSIDENQNRCEVNIMVMKPSPKKQRDGYQQQREQQQKTQKIGRGRGRLAGRGKEGKRVYRKV